MARKPNYSFEKRQRENKKRKKKEEKLERKRLKRAGAVEEEPAATPAENAEGNETTEE